MLLYPSFTGCWLNHQTEQKNIKYLYPFWPVFHIIPVSDFLNFYMFLLLLFFFLNRILFSYITGKEAIVWLKIKQGIFKIWFFVLIFYWFYIYFDTINKIGLYENEHRIFWSRLVWSFDKFSAVHLTHYRPMSYL